jgi:3-oxoacyl-[acyl-carrier protein] reductase
VVSPAVFVGIRDRSWGYGSGVTEQVAIVTGASRGIGRATAVALAASGVKVVINYARSSTAADEVVAQITEAGGSAIALQADVSQADQVDA